jgi:hypothetical protein
VVVQGSLLLDPDLELIEVGAPGGNTIGDRPSAVRLPAAIEAAVLSARVAATAARVRPSQALLQHGLTASF